MTPAPNQLWNLSGQLFELLEEREAISERLTSQQKLIAVFGAESKPEYAEDLANIQAELDAINTGITAFVQNKLQEVDELRTPLIALERAVALNKADAVAATNRAMVLQNRHDKLKDLIKMAMETLAANGFWKPKQSRKFESARGSFSLVGNGGALPVEIHDETLVPDEYKRITVTMSLNLWMERGCSAFSGCDVKTSASEVSKSAIAEALAKPCPKCNGACSNSGPGVTGHTQILCPECGGSGKQGVPGCRLGVRDCSVRIK